MNQPISACRQDHKPMQPFRFRHAILKHAIPLVLLLGMAFSGATGAVAETRQDGPVTSARWPANSEIPRNANSDILLVFLHPRCECSESTLQQIGILTADRDSPLTVKTVFYCPADQPETWIRTGLWQRAREVAAGSMVVDRAGVEARRFGATSSGHCFLYDAGGRQLFSGGIGGGQADPGFVAMKRLLNGQPATTLPSPAQGCLIPGTAAAAASSDFFTNYGNYLPRIHCMRTAEGNSDWTWIWIVIALNVAVLVGYMRIVLFWYRCYRGEQKQDRNEKLMQLAGIFLLCATCGYAFSIISFFWPAYRLLALALAALSLVTWRFAFDLEPFRKSFTAHRLQRELNEALEQDKRALEVHNNELQAAHQALSEATRTAQMLSLVAKYTGNSVVITDADARIEWVNEGFTRMTGYRFEEVKGLKPGHFLQGPDTDPKTVEKIREALRNDQGFDVEIINYHKNGTPYWLDIEVRPIHDDHGKVIKFIAIESDITKRKKSEARMQELTRNLRSQKQTLNAVLESVPAGIISLNHNGEVISYNSAATKIFGESRLRATPAERARSAKVLDPITHQAIPAPELPTTQAMSGETVRNRELLVRREGRDTLVSVNATPLTLEGEQGAVLAVMDISERWKRDLDLRLLREGLDFANDAMFVYDDTGMITDVNEVSCTRYGYTRDELLLMSIYDLQAEPLAMPWPLIWRRLQKKKAMLFETIQLKKDGSTFSVEVSANFSKLGGKECVYGFVRDIRDRQQAEREREHLAKKLQSAARQAGMAEVATGVLHNVGNVLNSVNVSANLLRERIRTSPVEKLCRASRIIAENENDLGNFLTGDQRGKHFPRLLTELASSFETEQDAQIQELQDLTANIEHIKEIVAMQQSFATRSGVTEMVDAREIFEDAVRICESGLRRHRVRLERDFEDVPPLPTQKHELLQILVNLIGNAKQASDHTVPEDRVIRLTARRDGEFVCMEVNDNGIGISKKNLTRIFQHGFTTKETGHGFGLHSSANTAQELGGTLTVHSDGEGKGATFSVKLPIRPQPDNPQPDNQNGTAPREAGAPPVAAGLPAGDLVPPSSPPSGASS